MPRGKSGVYGANVPEWTDEHWDLVKEGGFTRAVIRSDTDPKVAVMCRNLGIELVVQVPDRFNGGSRPDPSTYALRMLQGLGQFQPYSNLVVLDNEPNLYPERAGTWHAEEFTRWFRAVIACFRYYDTDCHWRLIMPAMSGSPGRNQMYWLHVNRENYLDCDASSAHCFWQEWWQIEHPQFGAQHELVHQLYPGKPLYILEYANSWPQASHLAKAQEYQAYISQLPAWVEAAYVFILGGTDDWAHFHLTLEEAHALRDVSG